MDKMCKVQVGEAGVEVDSWNERLDKMDAIFRAAD